MFGEAGSITPASAFYPLPITIAQRDMCLAEEGSVVPESASPRHSGPRYGDSVKYCVHTYTVDIFLRGSDYTG